MNSLYYQKRLSRNIGDKFFTSLSVICALISILPLIFLVTYILIKGGSQITPELFTLEPNPPGDTISSMLANQFGEADGSQVSSLFYAAFVLMILSLVVNIFVETIKA